MVRVARKATRNERPAIVPHPMAAVAAAGELDVIHSIVGWVALFGTKMLIGKRKHEVGVGRIRILIDAAGVLDIRIRWIKFVRRHDGLNVVVRPRLGDIIHFHSAQGAQRAV